MPEDAIKFAYIAEGKLYLQDGGNARRLMTSPFAEEIFARAERTRQRSEWKQSAFGLPTRQLAIMAA